MKCLPKAGILLSSLKGAPVGNVLEIGCYCGYSSIRMVVACPGVHVTTLEVDPVHMVIARNIIAFAGVAHAVDVWTGHSQDLVPRLAASDVAHRQPAPFSFVFMDQRGSRYNEDLDLLEESSLLRPGAVIVADNVLKPGA